MNRLITITVFLFVFVAQAIPCVNTGMKRVLIKCCGNPFSLNVCSTGSSGKCEEGYDCSVRYVLCHRRGRMPIFLCSTGQIGGG